MRVNIKQTLGNTEQEVSPSTLLFKLTLISQLEYLPRELSKQNIYQIVFVLDSSYLSMKRCSYIYMYI